jgi:hypothetical protein
MMSDFSELKVGKSTIALDGDGQIVSSRVGESRMSTRPDDGVPGQLPFKCENGHGGMTMEVPAIIASLTGNSMTTEVPCPFCGGKLSAPGGYYVRNQHGVFERVSGMPS